MSYYLEDRNSSTLINLRINFHLFLFVFFVWTYVHNFPMPVDVRFNFWHSPAVQITEDLFSILFTILWQILLSNYTICEIRMSPFKIKNIINGTLLSTGGTHFNCSKWYRHTEEKKFIITLIIKPWTDACNCFKWNERDI